MLNFEIHFFKKIFMELFYREYGEDGQSPIIILHGLLGSSDNWMGLGKKLGETHKVYILDQRNHGRSPWSEEWNYEIMAQDVAKFLAEKQLNDVCVVGHSMGGKVAMWLAAAYAPERVSKLAVVDMAPRAYPVHHDQILESMRNLDLNALTSRKDADAKMSQSIAELGTRQFLLKNLDRGKEGYRWRVNLEVIYKNIAVVSLPFPDELRFDKPTLFIRGLQSSYIRDEDKELIEQHFPQAELADVVEAGHWVHAEKPMEVLALLQNFL